MVYTFERKSSNEDYDPSGRNEFFDNLESAINKFDVQNAELQSQVDATEQRHATEDIQQNTDELLVGAPEIDDDAQYQEVLAKAGELGLIGTGYPTPPAK